MTVLEVARYPVDASRVADFEARLSRLVAAVRGRPGLLWAEAMRAVDDDPSYLLLIEWRTAGDADAWDQSGEPAAFEADADGLLRGDVGHRRFTSA